MYWSTVDNSEALWVFPFFATSYLVTGGAAEDQDRLDGRVFAGKCTHYLCELIVQVAYGWSCERCSIVTPLTRSSVVVTHLINDCLRNSKWLSAARTNQRAACLWFDWTDFNFPHCSLYPPVSCFLQSENFWGCQRVFYYSLQSMRREKYQEMI